MDPNGPRLFLVGLRKPFKGMAGTTGLEPAASAVTGQRSNQLNYVPFSRSSSQAQLTGSPDVNRFAAAIGSAANFDAEHLSLLCD